MTDPSQDRLLIVDIPSGRVAREVRLAGEPQFLAADPPGTPVMVSLSSGEATILTGSPVHRVKTFTGFASAPAVAFSPDAENAYLTDAQSGRLTVIGLYNDKILSRLRVGIGAHHLAFSPNESHVWVALGEAAKTIAILSTVKGRPSPPTSSPVINAGRPQLIGRFDPGFLAHGLAFAPDGRQVWITSASTQDAGVFSARTHRLLYRVSVGPPPQHVVLADGYAYLTSGYGSRIEQVALASGHVIRRASAPYGSFDLAAGGGYVVTVSLLRGTIAIYNRQLRLLRVRRVAPSLKDVVLTRP